MPNSPGKSQPVLANSAARSSSGAASMAPAMTNQLRRSFSVRDGVALIISNVVGAGVFTTIASISKLVPQPSIMLALWIAGGGLALAGAMSYAQLARRWPAAGGEYIYLSNAYGPTAGFLTGWTSLVAGFSGAVALNAVVLVSYLGHYFPALDSDHHFLQLGFHFGAFTFSPRTMTAALIIVIFALLHAFNIGAGKITQSALAFLIVGFIVAFCLFGFVLGKGSWGHFQSARVPLRP